ncbi:MAG: prepilin-type N-terminal cleavage/methylation domain-containing protein [Rariglobus sp.]
MSSPHTHRAFTLTELLVTIAIIGVLAGITIPTISSVRASASQSRCSTQLRQTAVAQLMVFADNKGSLKNESISIAGVPTLVYNPSQVKQGRSLYLGAPDRLVHGEAEVSPTALTSEFKARFAITTAKNKAYYQTTSYWHNPHVWTATKNTNSLYATSDPYGLIGPLEPTRMAMLCVINRDVLIAGNGQAYVWEWSPDRFEYYDGNSTFLAFFDGHVEKVAKDKVRARWAGGS